MNKILISIITLAFVLRLVGINYGYPLHLVAMELPIPRIFAVIVSTITIIPIYFAAKKFSEKAAYLSVFIFSILPIHVSASHFATKNVFITFLVASLLYLITLAVKSPFKKFIVGIEILLLGALSINYFKSINLNEWNRFITTFFTQYPKDMGIGLWILFMLLIILFIFFNKRQTVYVITILPIIIFTGVIGSHYVLLAPIYVVSISVFLAELYDKYNLPKYTAWSVLFLLLAPSIYMTLYDDYRYSVKDTRNYAYEWIQTNLNSDKDFLFVYGDGLDLVQFQDQNIQEVGRVDVKTLSPYRQPPYYLFLGKNDATLENILTDDDSEKTIEGNYFPLIRDSEKVFEVQNKDRFGPPIYIFKVKSIN